MDAVRCDAQKGPQKARMMPYVSAKCGGFMKEIQTKLFLGRYEAL
jgi:hypothetical protein